jgi:hypothetical protein
VSAVQCQHTLHSNCLQDTVWLADNADATQTRKGTYTPDICTWLLLWRVFFLQAAEAAELAKLQAAKAAALAQKEVQMQQLEQLKSRILEER